MTAWSKSPEQGGCDGAEEPVKLDEFLPPENGEPRYWVPLSAIEAGWDPPDAAAPFCEAWHGFSLHTQSCRKGVSHDRMNRAIL
jgi:hypothetical protein